MNTATNTHQLTTTHEPTATQQFEYPVYIVVSQANMYKGPALQYGMAYSKPYKRGEEITVLARNPSGLWLYGKAPDGKEGWLYYVWVKLDIDSKIIPTASYIPSMPLSPTRRPGSQQSGCNPPPDCGGGPYDPNTCQCQ